MSGWLARVTNERTQCLVLMTYDMSHIAFHFDLVLMMSSLSNDCSQFSPSKCMVEILFKVPESMQCGATPLPSGLERGV